MFVHRAHEAGDDSADDPGLQARATLVVQELRKLLTVGASSRRCRSTRTCARRAERPARPQPRRLPHVLRPVGADVEFQALLRATPMAGPDDLARDFLELINPSGGPRAAWRTARCATSASSRRAWSPSGFPGGRSGHAHQARPRWAHGRRVDRAAPAARHADATPSLRVTSTLPALGALEAEGLIPLPTRVRCARRGCSLRGCATPESSGAGAGRQRPGRPPERRRNGPDHRPARRRASGLLEHWRRRPPVPNGRRFQLFATHHLGVASCREPETGSP